MHKTTIIGAGAFGFAIAKTISGKKQTNNLICTESISNSRTYLFSQRYTIYHIPKHNPKKSLRHFPANIEFKKIPTKII